MSDKPGDRPASATDGEIGILARRRIEAGVIAPIYQELCARLGEDMAQSIIDAAIRKAAVEAGQAFAAKTPGGTSLRTFQELQSLWTQAREKLPVTTIILSNRKYQILLGEYQNVGANPGRTAMDMLDLGNPDIGWVKMAEAMGVEAAQATTLDQVGDLMAQSFSRSGPFLIELVI